MQPLLNPISAAPKRKHPSYSGVAPSFAPESAAGPSSSSAGKRTRFADQESDEAHAQGSLPGVDIDLLEQDAKRNQQGRKGRIVTDGYDSEEESEDEEEEQDKDQEDGDGGLEADGADEEEEDMFGDGNAGDVDVAKARAKGKEQDKKKKGGKEGYLELGDIDGQEFDAQRDQTGDVLSDESDRDEERDPELELEGEDEDEDEDDEEGGDAKGKGKAKAGKKGKSADPFDDMGHKLSSFNMKSEMQSGRFDSEGNYQANARDPHAEHDAWLAGNYSRKSIKAAREAKEKREQEARIQEREEKREVQEEDGRWGMVREMVEMMKEEETVLETLQRLGKEAKGPRAEVAQAAKLAAKEKRKAGKVVENGNGEASSSSSTGKGKESASAKHPSITRIERFTALASRLSGLTAGLTDIYDEEYRSLLRQVRRAGVVPQDWDPAAAATKATEQKGNGGPDIGDEEQWEYKWATAEDTSSAPAQTFGPFKAQDLEAWRGAGYFGAEAGGTERILLRRRRDGGGEESWRSWRECFSV